jgi:formylglycine-generating enzyme required for sulfatase activity
MTVKVGNAAFELVRIPAGTFLMGGTDGIEKPLHKVWIGYDFEMGTTEVIIGQFRAFLQATGYVTDGEKEGISWTRGTDQDWQSEETVDWRHATCDQSDDHPANSRSVFPLFGVPRLRGSDWSFPPEGGTPNGGNNGFRLVRVLKDSTREKGDGYEM